jgi:hypothetical protein
MSPDRADELRGLSAPKSRTREPPPGVAARMAVLRVTYVPETVAAAAERLARERPPAKNQPFEVAVALRLEELRSLLELAAHLHRAPTDSNSPSPQKVSQDK